MPLDKTFIIQWFIICGVVFTTPNHEFMANFTTCWLMSTLGLIELQQSSYKKPNKFCAIIPQ
jgi:hypothetical protein